jgi:hypothetical protein
MKPYWKKTYLISHLDIYLSLFIKDTASINPVKNQEFISTFAPANINLVYERVDIEKYQIILIWYPTKFTITTKTVRRRKQSRKGFDWIVSFEIR